MSLQKFRCISCIFFGYNEKSLNQHLSKNEICHYFDKQKHVTTGLLPDTSSLVKINNCNSSVNLSYEFQPYSIDDVTNQVHLDIIDDTLQKRRMMRIFLTNNNSTKINSFIKDSLTIAGMQDNNVASSIQLDEDYKTTDNTLSIPSNNR